MQTVYDMMNTLVLLITIKAFQMSLLYLDLLKKLAASFCAPSLAPSLSVEARNVEKPISTQT